MTISVVLKEIKKKPYGLTYETHWDFCNRDSRLIDVAVSIMICGSGVNKEPIVVDINPYY